MITKALLLIAYIVIMPMFTGFLFFKDGEIKSNFNIPGFLKALVFGLVTEWAFFYVVSVPIILKLGVLSSVVKYMNVCYVVLALLGIARLVLAKVKAKPDSTAALNTERKPLSTEEILLLGLFLVIVIFQVYKNLTMFFPDGDDAYYVSIALTSESADTMYVNEVYTGVFSQLNYRYALAPFPMWIAFLSRVTTIHAGVMAKTILSTFLILITYVIYNELSKALFKDERNKRYAFLSLFSIAALFGNYSISTAETFMLTRARQGKEALSSILLPLLWLLILYVQESSKDRKAYGKTELQNLILIIFCNIAAALSSVFGNILVLFVLLFWFLINAIKYKSFKRCFTVALLTIPNLCICLLYYLKR